MKKILVISTSVIVLGLTVYSVHSSLSHASKTTPAYEHYYNNDKSSSSQSTNKSNTNTNTKDTIETSIHSKAKKIDTTPNSISVFVNKEYGLPSDYAPDDLVVPNVLFNISYFDEKKLMRQEAATHLEKLFNAAKEDGYKLYAISAYRSYARQEDIYNNNIRKRGLEHTNQYSAKPGFSEHQTGLAIDVSSSSVGNRLEDIFADSKEGKWLEKNCYKYGFIIRYPDNKSDITGYSYEPWHIRYVGKDLAAYLFTNSLTLEEYYNYTPSKEFLENTEENVVDVDPNDYKVNPTNKPNATKTPSPSPVVHTTPSPSPTPTESTIPDDSKETDDKGDTPTETKIPTETKKPSATKAPTQTKKPSETLKPSSSPTHTPTPTKKPSSGDSSDGDNSTSTPSPSSSPSPTTSGIQENVDNAASN